jgi:hypothetical protein
MTDTDLAVKLVGLARPMELLAEASERRLVAITDKLDRPHLLRLPENTEASREDVLYVLQLLRAGLARLGAELPAPLPWSDGSEVHGRSVVPTQEGLTALGRWPLSRYDAGWGDA